MKKTMISNLIVLLVVNATISLSLAQSEPNQFDLSTILPASLIQTSTYAIATPVTVKDFQFQFQVSTRHGTFPVSGILLLEKRLSELKAIEAAGAMSQENVALKSAWETVRKTPRGAGHLLSDPLGVLTRAPRGFERMATDLLNPIDRRAGSESKRKLAVSLGVDSETRNPVLDHLLDRLVAREFVGGAATKFALSAAIPGLGLLSSMEDAQQVILTRAPHEIVADLNSELTQMGVWAPVKDAFINNIRWTTLEKLTFVQFYRSLSGVEHADVMFYLANQDASEAEILQTLMEMRLLAELHSRSPIQSITDGGLPVAWLIDGQIVGVCSVDYLTNSELVQKVASGFRRANPQRKISFISTGWVSPNASQTLATNDINFIRANFATTPDTGVGQNPIQSGIRR